MRRRMRRRRSVLLCVEDVKDKSQTVGAEGDGPEKERLPDVCQHVEPHGVGKLGGEDGNGRKVKQQRPCILKDKKQPRSPHHRLAPVSSHTHNTAQKHNCQEPKPNPKAHLGSIMHFLAAETCEKFPNKHPSTTTTNNNNEQRTISSFIKHGLWRGAIMASIMASIRVKACVNWLSP